MTRPYSLDLRERAVARCESGSSCRAVAALFSVSVASVVRWSQRKRATGSVAAKAIGGRRRPLALEGQRVWLLRRIQDKPDVTLRGLIAELAEQGVAVSYGAVWGFFARHGVSFKKKPAGQRTGPARRRQTA